MERVYIAEKTFSKIDIAKRILEIGEYEKCVFNNCNFYDSDIPQLAFIDCKLENCDLSLIKVN